MTTTTTATTTTVMVKAGITTTITVGEAIRSNVVATMVAATTAGEGCHKGGMPWDP
jgi:hypothetical protein